MGAFTKKLFPTGSKSFNDDETNFSGVMSGIYFNGLYLLDMAAVKHPDNRQEGDVSVLNDATGEPASVANGEIF